MNPFYQYISMSGNLHLLIFFCLSVVQLLKAQSLSIKMEHDPTFKNIQVPGNAAPVRWAEAISQAVNFGHNLDVVNHTVTLLHSSGLFQ